jgi:hypothetical protein
LEWDADDWKFAKANQKATRGIVYACYRSFRRFGNCWQVGEQNKQLFLQLLCSLK